VRRRASINARAPRDKRGTVPLRAYRDPISGPFLETCVDCVAQRGFIFVYGFLSGASAVLPFESYAKEVKIMPYSMSPVFLNPDARGRGMRYINARLRAGAFKPIIDRVFPLEQVVEAFRYLAGKSVRGKVVLVPQQVDEGRTSRAFFESWVRRVSGVAPHFSNPSVTRLPRHSERIGSRNRRRLRNAG
jgi:hypothetical protein